MNGSLVLQSSHLLPNNNFNASFKASPEKSFLGRHKCYETSIMIVVAAKIFSCKSVMPIFTIARCDDSQRMYFIAYSPDVDLLSCLKLKSFTILTMTNPSLRVKSRGV